MSTRILVGDCRETLATLPAGSVHCIVTSPPYYGLRDYGVSDQIGLEDTPDAYVAEMVGVFRALRRVLREDGVAWLNLGDSYAGSNAQAGGDGSSSRLGPSSTDSAWTRSQQAMRTVGTGAVKPGEPGNLLGIPWRVAFALQSDGWTLRDACVWHKPNPMPESVAGTRWEGDTLRRGSWRHTSAHEMVFMLTKGMGYFCDQEAVREPVKPESAARYDYAFGGPKNVALRNGDKPTAVVGDRQLTSGRNPRNVWSITTKPYSGAHFATMPPDLAERCIKSATSARGVCPACGAQWAPVVKRGEARTADHRPTCDCPPAEPIPAMVLDPFGGAGTTALVADRLGRDAILCELNADYAELARSRLVGDAPMLASVEVTA